jgi:putative RNA 2'-phosphotransferase
MNKQDLKISRKLCYLLRHNNRDLNMDEFGYINTGDITKELNINIDDLLRIVEEDNKVRYTISKDKIKANYGHSIDIIHNYTVIKPPAFLYHGTAKKFINSIKDLGITKQKRQFIHLTDNYHEAIQVGSRHGEPIVLEVNSILLYNEGQEFYKSNNIYLTNDIGSRYIININKV